MTRIGRTSLLSSASFNTSVGGNLLIPSQKMPSHNNGYIIGVHGQNTIKNNYMYGIDIDSSGNYIGYAYAPTGTQLIKFNDSGIIYSKLLTGFTVASFKYESAVDEIFFAGYDDSTSDTTIVRITNATGAIASQYKTRHGVSGNYNYNIDTNSTLYVKGFNGYNSATSTYFSGVQVNNHSHSISWTAYLQDPVSGTASYAQSVAFSGTDVYFAASKQSSTNGIDINKYNSSGTRQWTFHVQNTSNAASRRLATDSTGNVYMADYISDATNNANKGFQVVKLNSSGTLQWKYKYDLGGSSAPTYVRTLNIDSSDFIYVVGYTSNTAGQGYTISKDYRVPSVSNQYGYVCKINSSTGALVWAKYIATPTHSVITGSDAKISGDKLWIAFYANNSSAVAAIPLNGQISRTEKTVLTHPFTGQKFNIYIGNENFTASVSACGTSASQTLQSASTPTTSATTPSYGNTTQTTGSINQLVRL